MTRFAPLWQQAGSFPAGLDRQLLGALWPFGGQGTGVAVTTVLNTMNVSISPGAVAVPLQAGQGAALCRWDAAEVVTLAAAPASGNSRLDLIICQVRDNALDAGPNNDFIFSAVTGTPSTGFPSIPVTPANAYALAYVLVSGAVANLNTASIQRFGGNLAPAKGVLANPMVTVNQSGITSQVDVTGLTATIWTLQGQRLKISAGCAYISAPVPPSDQYGFYILEDGVTCQVGLCMGGASPAPVIIRSPAPGLHTYKVQVAHTSGSSAGVMSAGASSPAWLLIEDMGAIP